MLRRCEDSKNKAFHYYGGRVPPITVCERWHSFESFLADMGRSSPGMTLERKNNAGNYEPGNCKWVTRKEQANNRRNNRLLTFDGKTRTIAQWSEELNLSSKTIFSRLRRVWSIDKTLTTPRLSQGRKDLEKNHDSIINKIPTHSTPENSSNPARPA